MSSPTRRYSRGLLVVFLLQVFSTSVPAFAAETGSGSASTGSTLESTAPKGKEGDTKAPPIDANSKQPAGSAAVSQLAATQTGSASSSQPARKDPIPQPDLASGALTYAYTLTVPPGRNGLQPQITLSYNSQNTAEGSIVGYGWTLDIPSIERVNKTGTDRLYLDGYFSSSLSGELVATGGQGYRAKVDGGDFLEYIFAGTMWTVKDKKGTTYTFGASSASRQDDPSDGTRISKWLLAEVRDTNDNFVRYEYAKDSGQIYPSRIVYTGSGATDGIFEVEFIRQVRLDVTRSYQTGYQVITSSRINEIRAKVNGTWRRKVTLAYGTGDNGRRSVLQKIIESGQDGGTAVTTLPDLSFTYGNGKTSLAQDNGITYPWVTWTDTSGTQQTSPLALTEPGVRMIDIDGDSLKDIVKSSNTQVNGTDFPVFWVLKNTGRGWQTASGWNQPVYTFTNGQGQSVTNRFVFDATTESADWNGDGREDLIRFWAENIGGGQNLQHAIVLLNTGTGWVQDVSVSTDIATFADFNGNQQHLYVTSGSSAPAHLFTDLNGDGLVDYLYASNAQYLGVDYPRFAVLYNRSGRLVWDQNVAVPWVTFSSNGNMVTTPLTLGGNVQAAEINGDGLIDFLSATNSQQNGVDSPSFWVLVNNGHGWTQNPSIPQPTYSLIDSNGAAQTSYFITNADWRSMDVNGDGLTDWVRLWNVNLGGGITRNDKAVLLNTGSGWSQNDASLTVGSYSFTDQDGNLQTGYPTTGSSSVFFLDMDGDGIDDIFSAGFTQYLGVYYPRDWTLRGSRSATDIATAIRLPYGGGYQFAYQSSALYRDVDGNRLNPAMASVMRTVATVTTDNGAGVATATTLSYSGGRSYYASPTDRRFAGFAQVRSTDATGTTTITSYHQGDESNSSQGEYADHSSKIGRPYRTETRDVNGNRFTVGITKWDRTDLGNGRSFVFPSTTLQQAYDGGSTHRDQATSITYDTNGNPIQTKDWGEVTGSDNGTFTDVTDGVIVTNTSYASAVTSGVRGAPCVVSVVDGSNTLLSESRTYYDGLALCQVGKGNATKAEKLLSGSGYYASTVTYNSFGLPTATTDWKGNTTTMTYEPNTLYPATVTNALGHVATTTTDLALGQPTESTDANGGKTRSTYDGLGRLTKVEVSDPASPTTLKVAKTMAYADTSMPFKVTSTTFNGVTGDAGVESIQYLDGLGNLLQTRSTAEGSNQYVVTSRTYDATFRLLKETLPVFQTGGGYVTPVATDKGNQFTYDALGRITVLANAVGTIGTVYTPWQKEVTDANGHKKRQYQDARGNTVKLEELSGASVYPTTYTYDLLNRITRITDAEGNIRDYSYDSLGRLLNQTMLHAPSQAASSYGSWSYTYDANDNVLTKTDPKGQVITYSYDALNRLKTEDYAGQAGVEVTNTYDTGTYGKGRLTSSVSQGITTSYAYDVLGRTTSTAWTVDGVARTQTATYDLMGNPKTATYPNGKTVSMTYNNAYLPTTVSEGVNGLVSNVDYAPTGSISRIDFASGTSTVNTYDIAKLYRLTSKVTSKGATTYQDLAYTYDAEGNVTRITEAATTNAKRTVDYTYDDLDRLASANYSAVATGQPSGLQSFTYSATGNMLTSGLGSYLYQRTGYANPQAVTKVSTNRTYTYDKNGNLAGSTIAGVANTYTYDYRDRMVGSKKGTNPNIVYQYDHGYNRVKKWDKNGNKISLYFGDFEIEGTGDTTGKLTTTTLTRINVPLSGGQAASLEYNAVGTLTNKVFHHTDHLTGSSVETDGNGNLLETLDYHPYGAVRVNTKAGTYENKKKFTGKELDGESGLTYFGARYYDADIGRWMGWDPIQQDLPTLVKSGELNGYGYVKNNPIAGVDPDGLLTIVIHGTWGQNSFNSDEGEQFKQRVKDTFNEDVHLLSWSGANTSEARTEAAKMLANMINGHTFQEGEKLNIVGHSHGGNVALEATNLINHKVDNLITLGTPIRDDYKAARDMVTHWVNVYSNIDPVQALGGYNLTGKYARTDQSCNGKSCGQTPTYNDKDSCTSGGHTCQALSEVGTAGRKSKDASNNVNVTRESWSTNPHSALWRSSKVWDTVDLYFNLPKH